MATSTPGAGREFVELIGVNNADGGPVGEAKYVIGRFLGTAHCALCDITHSPVRRKPEWDRMVAAIGVPFRLLHLNEMPAEVAASVSRAGAPVVLARRAGQSEVLEPLLHPPDLERLGSSVGAFERAL